MVSSHAKFWDTSLRFLAPQWRSGGFSLCASQHWNMRFKHWQYGVFPHGVLWFKPHFSHPVNLILIQLYLNYLVYVTKQKIVSYRIVLVESTQFLQFLSTFLKLTGLNLHLSLPKIPTLPNLVTSTLWMRDVVMATDKGGTPSQGAKWGP